MYTNSHKKILKVVTDTVDNIVIKRPLLPQPKDIKKKKQNLCFDKAYHSKKVEQEIRDSITESLNNEFSDGNQETEIISDKGSSDDIEESPINEDNDNEYNDNIDTLKLNKK
jgi:hypothetical protein